MKIILRQKFEQLGQVGDVVEVKDGYARNFLIPKNIAYPATEGYLRTLEEEKKQLAQRQQKELKAAQKLAGELEKVSITIPMKVGEDDKLFGSITSQMIVEALREKGYTTDKRQVELDESIRALGIYTVNIKLHPQVTGKVKVWVVRE